MRYLTFLAVLLAGCTYKFDPPPPNTLPKRLTYFKDDHGLCYAAISSQGAYGYYSVSITSVPCGRVNL